MINTRMKTNTINHQNIVIFDQFSLTLTHFLLKIIAIAFHKTSIITYLKTQKHLKTLKNTLKTPIFTLSNLWVEAGPLFCFFTLSNLQKTSHYQPKLSINNIWHTLYQTAILPQE
ncbi:hypothetical protein ACFL18_02295 [Patescibacteria group bacterium]